MVWDGPKGIGCEVGFCNFTPMSGFVQLLKINNQNRHEMGHQNSACAQQFQRTKKTHSRDAAVREQRRFNMVCMRCAGQAMHHQSWHPTFIADVKIKNTVKVEKTQAWSSRENGTPNAVQKASNHNPTYVWKRASKIVQQGKISKRTPKRPS